MRLPYRRRNDMSVLFRWGCDRKGVCAAVAGIGMVLIACSAVVGATSTDHKVTLEVSNIKLGQVIQTLIGQSGTNIVLAGDVADISITATQNELPLETVLNNVLKGSGVDYW